jgi:hypothetical protein
MAAGKIAIEPPKAKPGDHKLWITNLQPDVSFAEPVTVKFTPVGGGNSEITEAESPILEGPRRIKVGIRILPNAQAKKYKVTVICTSITHLAANKGEWEGEFEVIK